MMSEEALLAYQKAGMSGAAAAIALASEVKKSYHATWVAKNARRAVALAAFTARLICSPSPMSTAGEARGR